MLNSDRANVNKNDDGCVYKNVCERIHQSGDLANVLLRCVERIVSLVEFFFFGIFHAERTDDAHTVVRFATSWATTSEDIEALAAIL